VTTPFGALVAQRSVIVCCGTGGVGKTTAAAAIGLAAARLGRRVVVVTVDPARRLADALGVEQLTNEPQRVTTFDASATTGAGELWATMLDTKRTFDDLVGLHAADDAQRRRILSNRFYVNISGSLSGTQEYMAAEKLYELHADPRFDLVVVDTPPTRNALDVLDAPERLANFLDHRLYRTLMAPTRLYLKAANLAAQAFMRAVSKVVGGEVIADAIAFFQAFDGMEQGFRERATASRALLGATDTAFVVIASPRADTVTEATWFIAQLAARYTPAAALIVNRAHPRFGPVTALDARRRARAARAVGTRALWTNLAELTEVADAEDAVIAPLRESLGDAPTVIVPLRATDLHDLAALASLADDLLG
jgi:anion-transporting  ArsA/GET3 family ATPase